MYQIVLVDFDECYIAKVYSDGEILKLFEDTSLVPHKMGVGGQSALRFQKIRENEIVQWFKSINEQIMKLDGEIILGISSVYYNKFEKCLHTYSKNKIARHMPIECNGLSGIYSLLNTLHREKKNVILT